MNSTYPSTTVANTLIHIAWVNDQPISHLRVQKLAYLAHGWSLALFDRPLLHEPIEAWEYGTVIPSIYHALKPYGNNILQPIPIHGEHLIIRDQENYNLLEQIDNIHQELSDTQLAALCAKRPTSPWWQTRFPTNPKHHQPASGRPVIPNEVIRAHFQALRENLKVKEKSPSGA